MQRAFIVKVDLDPSVDPESMRQSIESAISDTLYVEGLEVTTWSGHDSSQPQPPPLTFPPL